MSGYYAPGYCPDCGAAGTPFPGARATGSAKENQFTPILDAQGYVIGGTCTRDLPDQPYQFLAVLQSLRERYPLDPADIVWPNGWPVDADGRLLSVLEVTRQRLTHHTEGQSA